MLVAIAFLVLERLAPGRELPHAPGWYARAVLINATQALIYIRHQPSLGQSSVRRLTI
jgi:hypothetical protein